MPLPPELNTVVLTGKFVDLMGNPIVGVVSFTATPAALLAPISNVIIQTVVVTATLDSAGAFSIVLPATNDADVNPINWTYTVTEPGSRRTYPIDLPLPGPHDLADLATVPTSDGDWIVSGPQNLFVQQATPAFTGNAMWVELDEAGDPLTVWVNV